MMPRERGKTQIEYLLTGKLELVFFLSNLYIGDYIFYENAHRLHTVSWLPLPIEMSYLLLRERG